jgi:4-diphosphocytidyl-2-C-methyl-D-erythritol kinase
MPLARTILLRSYAKINLGLHVLSRRDDGYHELRTLFQSIDFHDTIRIEKTRRDGISFQSDCPSIDPQDNLVVKAIQAVCDLSGVRPRMHVQLEKRIPLGAGLGGGSSNAASALWGVNRLLNLKLSMAELLDIGGGLGSDVCFFFLGGLALGIGRGSEVYPLPDQPERHLLLAVPEFPVATPQAYGRLSLTLTKFLKDSKIPVFCSDCLDYLSLGGQIRNDFEQVIFDDYPALRRLKDKLLRSGAQTAAMTGSGSVVFGFFASQKDRDQAQHAQEWTRARLIPARTLTRAEYQAGWVESLR